MMPIMINDAPVECINTAAIYFRVPATLILSVIKKENGRNGDAIKNKSNGTYDYGIMQINSIWLSKISGYGYTKEDIQFNACKNVFVGTWILAQSIAEGKNIWQGVGNYHSHTPRHNEPYRNDISKTYQKISYALKS